MSGDERSDDARSESRATRARGFMFFSSTTGVRQPLTPNLGGSPSWSCPRVIGVALLLVAVTVCYGLSIHATATSTFKLAISWLIAGAAFAQIAIDISIFKKEWVRQTFSAIYKVASVVLVLIAASGS